MPSRGGGAWPMNVSTETAAKEKKLLLHVQERPLTEQEAR